MFSFWWRKKEDPVDSIELRVEVYTDEEMRRVKALIRRVEGVSSVETDMGRRKVTVYGGRNMSYTSVYRVLEDAGINAGPAEPYQSSTDTDRTSVFTASSGSSLSTKANSPSPQRTCDHSYRSHAASTSSRAGNGGGDIPCSGIKNYRDYTRYPYRPW